MTAVEVATPQRTAVPVRSDDAPMPSPVIDDAEIARLAKLSPLQYERERETAAKRLGISRVSILDRLVKAMHGNRVAAGQGRPLELPAPKPWSEPVNGAALLAEVAAAIRWHVVIDAAEVVAVALWVVAVHVFDAWIIFPRLFITAPEKQCGKTTLLDVPSRFVPKPLVASSITAASLFRVIEAARPTLLLDEADTYARDNEDLRGVLNAGHRSDGAVIRTVGDDHEPRQFSAWAPVALAAIGRLPGTIEDRSIRTGLRRRRPDETVRALRLDRTGELEDLARQAARWAADHTRELAVFDPEMPEGIVNRAADNWRPLLAVAELAGDVWPERPRRAAVELSSEGDDQSSIRVALLADIRAAFAAEAVDRLASDRLAAYLGKLDDRPWPDYRAGNPISKSQIARLLKPLGVSSGTIRLSNGSTPKGYYLTAFRDAFARYLPAESATTRQSKQSSGSAPDAKAPHGNGCGVSEMPGTKSISATCGAVADQGPEAEERAWDELNGAREKAWLQ
jgi:putative DNA primase/helicase